MYEWYFLVIFIEINVWEIFFIEINVWTIFLVLLMYGNTFNMIFDNWNNNVTNNRSFNRCRILSFIIFLKNCNFVKYFLILLCLRNKIQTINFCKVIKNNWLITKRNMQNKKFTIFFKSISLQVIISSFSFFQIYYIIQICSTGCTT